METEPPFLCLVPNDMIEKMLFLSDPFRGLTTKLVDIMRIKKKSFDALLEIDRILTPFDIDDRAFLEIAERFPDDLTCFARVEERMDSVFSKTLYEKRKNKLSHFLADQDDKGIIIRHNGISELFMEFFRFIPEFAHIPEKKNFLIVIIERGNVLNSTGNRLKSAIITPIDDDRFTISFKNCSPSLLWIDVGEHISDRHDIDAECNTHDEHRENIINLEIAQKRKTHLVLFPLIQERKRNALNV
jgi:hypothetical protein